MLVSAIKAFLDDDAGATAIEYGLIGALVAVGCIAAFGALGTGLISLFGMTDSKAGGQIASAAALVNP